jgi:glycosyltransferase involved in cell wall biosynthesis
LLLWRIRKVFQDYPREYEILVFNDGSSDATADTLQSYTDVLPLTIMGADEHVGYARALDALCREVSRRTRYPRRDAMIVMQADFTDQPEHLPELIKRFEGGADLVVAERPASSNGNNSPRPVRWLRRFAPLVLRPLMKVPGVSDPFGTFRLYRITLLRDLIRHAGDEPIVQGTVWAANVDLLVRTAHFARRIETVELEPRYDLRPRASRIHPWTDAVDLYRFGRTRPRRPLPSRAALLCSLIARRGSFRSRFDRRIRRACAHRWSLRAQAVSQAGISTAIAQTRLFPSSRRGTLPACEFDSRRQRLHGSRRRRHCPWRPAWHDLSDVHGGTLFFKVNDRLGLDRREPPGLAPPLAGAE